jgi:hypothetical protein
LCFEDKKRQEEKRLQLEDEMYGNFDFKPKINLTSKILA